ALRMLVRLARDESRPGRSLLIGSVCAGLLPWFHVRYLVIAVSLAIAAVLLAIRRSRVPVRRALVAMLPAIGGIGALGALYLWMYGTVAPSKLSKYVTHKSVHWSIAEAYRFGFGSLLGATRGLL